MKDLHPIISENLSFLRKNSGLTQAQLAERLGYSDKAVSRWERGDTLPDINVLYELCDFYGVPFSVLTEKNGGFDQKPTKIRNSLQYYVAVCALAVCFVWLIATVSFVYVKTRSGDYFWQAFVWAVPASSIIVMMMNRKFRNSILLFICCSVTIWTTLTAFYLQLLSYNIWLVFILGIPIQVILILWFTVKKYK